MGVFMDLVPNGQSLSFLIGVLLWLLLGCGLSYGTETDIYCLKTIKSSLEDPYNYLNSSWNFNNNTEGYICKFAGIECWHPEENRVLNIKLPDMGLKGQFPRAIKNCSTLTGLDLSGNKLYGTIPNDVSNLIEFVTALDLSSNDLSGEIPVSLANCSYLNVLKLDNNRLTGHIPVLFGLLNRIKTFNVSNNLLTGQVPTFGNASISADSYANNPGLCGGPFEACKLPLKKSHAGVIVGAAIGAVTVTALAVGVACSSFFSLNLPMGCACCQNEVTLGPFKNFLRFHSGQAKRNGSWDLLMKKVVKVGSVRVVYDCG